MLTKLINVVIFLAVIGFFIVMPISALIEAIHVTRKGDASVNWPEVKAKILSVSKRYRSGSFTGPSYCDLLILYSYNFGDKKFESYRLNYKMSQTYHCDFVREFIAKNPVGSTINIFVDPDDPENATVYSGGPKHLLLTMVFLPVVFLFGLVLLYSFVKVYKQKEIRLRR